MRRSAVELVVRSGGGGGGVDRVARQRGPVLWERGEELRRLREAVDRARQGQGSLALVSGEAGIGKTSLVRAFAEQVGERARVLSGAGEDLLTPRVLGPFRDMFRDAGIGVPADRADRDGWIDALLGEMGYALRPTVVVVDDAHWADDASLDILRYLGRRVDGLPALLVVAYRGGDLTDAHPLRRTLGAFTGPATMRLELAPLSDATVARLAEEAGADPARMVTAVGGNPFYLTEALSAGGSEVPATVRDAVIARVRGLPARTQRALEILSVVPHAVEPDLLEAVTGGTTQVLEQAERAGMVAVRGGRIGFRHELARRAVEASLPASCRIELNRRVLRALEVDAAEPSRMVHHAVAAADREAVARLAPAAAEEAAAAEAHHETLAFARLALEHAGPAGAGAAARLHGLAGYALYALNRSGAAAVHAEAAVRHWEAAGAAPLELGRALLLSSRMHTMLGNPARARADAVRAVATLEPLGPTPDLAHAHGIVGNLDAIEGDGRSAVGWCDRAVAGARALGRADVEAHARTYRGLARVGLGDLAGLHDLRAAIELARQVDHGDYLCRAASNLAVALIWLGRHREAPPYLEIAENAARDHGFDYHLFHVLVQRGHVEFFLGRWDSAERTLREQLATGRDPAAVTALPLALLGRILVRRGDPAGTALVAQAWELALRSRQVHRMAVAGGAVVEDAWLRGDTAALRTAARTLLPLADRANLRYLRAETLRYLRRAGLPAEAFEGCPPGFAAGIAGDWRSASIAWAGIGNPYEEALELAEAPDERTAFDALRRLDALGAAATATLVRQILRRRGIRAVPRGPQRATRGNPAGLTARQSAVLTLLAEGLTSAEVAERMHVSPRTVDNHVNGILARLGVPSRRRAVALATERGWLDTAADTGTG